MNKTELFKAVIDDVGNLYKSLQAFYNGIVSEPDFVEINERKSVNPEPVITLEQVRAVLAEKSRMGMTAAVRSLLNEYGVDKLSALEPRYYAELLVKAEGLNNENK